MCEKLGQGPVPGGLPIFPAPKNKKISGRGILKPGGRSPVSGFAFRAFQAGREPQTQGDPGQLDFGKVMVSVGWRCSPRGRVARAR
jgi:hypothetical protein